MKRLSLFLLFGLLANLVSAQEGLKGYIIGIENGQVYLDFNNQDVKVGDRIHIVGEPTVFVHPVTKEKITKKRETIATVQITETAEDYSVGGKVFPANAIGRLEVGQRAVIPDRTEVAEIPKDGKVNVAIADAIVNDVVNNGFFGGYVADLLMEEMLSCNKIRLIDRSIIAAQIGEVELADAGYINQESAIMGGDIAGVQYMVRVTVQKPDVVNITTGIPIKSILSAAGAIASIAGANDGVTKSLQTAGDLSSDVRTARLKASVSVSAQIVDLQTGEIMFMSSRSAIAQGESQLSLEEGALNGLQINGGVDGFRQTVTGKAMAMTFNQLGKDLRDYFNGEITQRVRKQGFMDSELTYRRGKIYMGVNKLSSSDMKSILSQNPDWFFDYRKAKRLRNWSYTPMIIGILTQIPAKIWFNDASDDKSRSEYYLNQYNLDPGGWEPDYLYNSYLYYRKESSQLLKQGIIFSVTGALITTGGILMYYYGTKNIKGTINTYNQNLRDKALGYIKPELDMGLSPLGFSLMLRF